MAPYGVEGGYVHQVPNGEKVTRFGFSNNQTALNWPKIAYAPDGRFLVHIHPWAGLTFLEINATTGKRSRYSWEDTEGRQRCGLRR